MILRRHHLSRTGVLAIAGLSICGPALGDDGDLDNGFGGVGTVVMGEVQPVDIVAQVNHKVTTQTFADGSVAVSGLRPHRITKYLPDGSLDAGFGVAGTTDVADMLGSESGTGFVRAPTGDLFSMAVTPTGAAVVVCHFDANGQPADFEATSQPCISTNFGNSPDDADWPQAIAIDGQGGIVVLARRAKLIRFHANGTLDYVFAVPTLSNKAQFHTLEDIEIQGDSVYLTGFLEEEGVRTDGIVHKFALVPGQAPTRDAQFNNGSYKTYPCANEPTPRCLFHDAVLSGGYLVAAGTGKYSGDFGTVVRINKITGEQDGIVSVLPIMPSPTTAVAFRSIAAQSNGDFIVAGTLRAGPSAPYDEVVVARVRAACGTATSPGFGGEVGSSLFTFDVDRFAAGTSASIGNGRVYVGGFMNTNGPIIEAVSALENSVAFLDGLFEDDFEGTCAP